LPVRCHPSRSATGGVSPSLSGPTADRSIAPAFHSARKEVALCIVQARNIAKPSLIQQWCGCIFI
ncbi:hypothetical protein BCR44DRAFT_1451339, partial [Catenaria anguillulae PL171]